MMMPIRNSRRTFLDEVFIRNAKSFWRTSPTLTFPLSFIVGNGSHCVTSRSLVLSCLSRSFTPTCMGLIIHYLFSSLAFEVPPITPQLVANVLRVPRIEFLTILVMSICEICPMMSSWLLSMNALLIGVSVSLHHVGLLLKVLDS